MVSEDVFYLVRLLTYLPGERVETVPYTEHLLYQLGQTIARFNNALQVMSITANTQAVNSSTISSTHCKYRFISQRGNTMEHGFIYE